MSAIAMLQQPGLPYVLLDGEKINRPEVMPKASARTFFIHIKEMSHGSFNVLEGMLPSVMGIRTVPEWSKAGPQQQLGVAAAHEPQPEAARSEALTR